MEKYNILFYPQKVKDNLHRLRVRVSWGTERVAINVGYVIAKDKWNKETCRCVRGSYHGKKKTSAAVINSEIQRWENSINDIMRGYDTIPGKERVKRDINSRLRNDAAKPESNTFVCDYIRFMSEQSTERNWNEGTTALMRSTLNRLRAWRDDVGYRHFSEEGFLNLIRYMQDSGCNNTSIHGFIKRVKWFLAWAVKRGLPPCPVCADFKEKLKMTEKTIVFLAWEELMRVYDYPFEDDELRKVRDVFCFTCFTGMRYSDVRRLRREDVRNDTVYLVTRKTGEPLAIELNRYSRQIYERYRDGNGVTLFDCPPLDTYNTRLRQIGKVCGIDETISETKYIGGKRVDTVCPKYERMTSHCGRRTFVCNALMLGISAEVVMRWTGHRDYKAMKPYIEIADNAKREAMSRFDRD